MTLATWQKIKVIGGALLALIVGAYLTMTALDQRLLMLTAISGGIFGWIMGILFSPRDKGEAKSFSDYRAGIGAFIGGAFVAKVQQYVEPYLVATTAPPETLALYLMYFAIAFGLGLLITWVGRKSDDMFG